MKTWIINLLRKPYIIRLITLGDQCMFAAGNFLLTILLTRFYTDMDLAAYGIALAIALVLQGVQKNMYTVQNSVLNHKIFRARSAKILGEHVIAIQPILIVLTLSSLFIAEYLPQSLLTHTIIATTVCFAIYAQLEFERIVLIKFEKYIIPFLTSFAFLVMVIGFLFFHAEINFYRLMVFLWMFAAFKTLLLISIVGMPDLKGGWILLRSDFRRNAMGSLLGVIGASGYTHGPVMALGAFSSTTQVAAYVALRSLLQPTQIIMRSLDVIDKNFFYTKAAGTMKGIRRTMMSQIMVYFLISASMSAIICLFGKEIIHLLYAGKHENFMWVLYGWGALSVFMAIVLPLESAIIVQKRLNEYNFLRLWIGIATVLLSVLMAGAFGAYGIISVSLAAGIAAFVAGYVIMKKAFTTAPKQVNFARNDLKIEVDKVNEGEWDSLLSQFDDASLYQTYAYGAVRWGKENLHHAVLKSGNEVLGLAQVTVKKLPFLPFLKFAYIPRGPLIKRNGQKIDAEILGTFLKELQDEFVSKRRCLLRVAPNCYGLERSVVNQVLQDVGFTRNPDVSEQRTFVLDLAPSMEEIRQNLDKTWRSSLSKAERSSLNVLQGTNAEHYAIFSGLYEKLLERKNFTPGVDYREFAKIQENLPESQKMQILICMQDDKPINAAIIAANGDTGIYIMGATDNQYVGANGSYLLQWHAIEWLKKSGFRYYDLGGIDPQNNPNVFRFKKGIMGKYPEESIFLGVYEASATSFDKLVWYALENGRRGLRKFLSNLKGNKGRKRRILKRAFGRAQRLSAASCMKTKIIFPKDFRAVSITFDDFPKSAMNGATILEEFGARGTFYVCMDLLMKDSPSGPIASNADLKDLTARGHEIGCHTYGHLDCAFTPADRIKQSSKRNIAEAQKSEIRLTNFAYPNGGMSLRTKRKMKKLFKTARSNLVGVNDHFADAHCLRAVPIYDSQNRQGIFDYIEAVAQDGGWLILYTHDVSKLPSRYGTSETLFRDILKMCSDRNLPVMSVDAVMESLKEKI